MTSKQRAFLERMSQRNVVLICHRDAGLEDKPWEWFIQKPYSKEDGRTVNSALNYGWLTYHGHRLYTISPLGRAAISSSEAA